MFPLSEAIAKKVLCYVAGRDDRGLDIEVCIRHGYKPCKCHAHTKVALASLACLDMVSKYR
jgi:hypothetical protein